MWAKMILFQSVSQIKSTFPSHKNVCLSLKLNLFNINYIKILENNMTVVKCRCINKTNIVIYFVADVNWKS